MNRSWMKTALGVVLGLVIGVGSFTAYAADGHPNIKAAHAHLKKAEARLEKAHHGGFGGHRAKAAALAKQAKDEAKLALAVK